MTSTFAVGGVAERGSTVLLVADVRYLRATNGRLDVFAAVPDAGRRGLFRVLVQLLEGGHSHQAGQRLVCDQKVVRKAGL
jgi:hypothetical protein